MSTRARPAAGLVATPVFGCRFMAYKRRSWQYLGSGISIWIRCLRAFESAVAQGRAAAHTPSYPRHNGRASASITRCGAIHMTNLVRSAATMVIAAAAGAALATLAMPVAGQAPPNRAPRTASGKPDLNGIWQALNEANYDIQMHMARPAMALRGGTVRSGARGAGAGAGRGRRGAAWRRRGRGRRAARIGPKRWPGRRRTRRTG